MRANNVCLLYLTLLLNSPIKLRYFYHIYITDQSLVESELCMKHIRINYFEIHLPVLQQRPEESELETTLFVFFYFKKNKLFYMLHRFNIGKDNYNSQNFQVLPSLHWEWIRIRSFYYHFSTGFPLIFFKLNNYHRHPLTMIFKFIAPKIKLVLYPINLVLLIVAPLTVIATHLVGIHKLALTFATVYLGLSSGLGG